MNYLSSGLMYQSECHFHPGGGTKSSLFNSICSSSIDVSQQCSSIN